MWFKSSVTIRAVVAISFCLIGGTVPAVADIIHVPGDYSTIQEAIDVAVDGDEVEVHPGTYFETINFLGKAITLRSSDGPDVTTIDGNGLVTTVNCGGGGHGRRAGSTVRPLPSRRLSHVVQVELHNPGGRCD